MYEFIHIVFDLYGPKKNTVGAIGMVDVSIIHS